MAEFAEVMRQRKRMCDRITCKICNLSNYKNEYGDRCEYFMVCHYEEAEKIIMGWAKAHPEPTYPTWKEWQNTNFPNAQAKIKPCMFGSDDELRCDMYTECGLCVNKPIPSEIAEKLGVKPKGVE